MEELTGGIVERAASSGFSVSDIFTNYGPIAGILIAVFFIFLSWKSGNLKSIKKRVNEYTTKKAEIAHEIVVNDKSQVHLNTTIEKTEELTDEKEKAINAITEKAAQDIKNSLAGTDLRATVNTINKKWNT